MWDRGAVVDDIMLPSPCDVDAKLISPIQLFELAPRTKNIRQPCSTNERSAPQIPAIRRGRCNRSCVLARRVTSRPFITYRPTTILCKCEEGD